MVVCLKRRGGLSMCCACVRAWQFLYKAVEKVIPDVRQRVKVELIGTAITATHPASEHESQPPREWQGGL